MGSFSVFIIAETDGVVKVKWALTARRGGYHPPARNEIELPFELSHHKPFSCGRLIASPTNVWDSWAVGMSFPFFLAPRAQKEPKTPRNFARCDERRGLRALDRRKLLKKLDQNFHKKRRHCCRLFLKWCNCPCRLGRWRFQRTRAMRPPGARYPRTQPFHRTSALPAVPYRYPRY